MTHPELRPEQLLASLGDEPVPPLVEEPAAAALRRKAVVKSMAGAMRREGTRRDRARTRLRVLAAVSLAAALALVVGKWAWAPSTSRAVAAGSAVPAGAPHIEGSGLLKDATGGVIVRRDGASSPIVADGVETALGLGDEVSTGAEARARIELSTAVGTPHDPGRAELDVAPATQLRMARASDVGADIALVLGRLSIVGSSAIASPDATVSGRGTFEVGVHEDRAAGRTVTSVVVTEGTVAVEYAGARYELGAGQRWSSDAPKADSASPPEPAAAAETRPTPARSARSAAGPAPATPPSASELAEQNRLLQAALGARRRGDDASAIRSLDELLSRFPTSPLAQEARVERMRALERSGDHAAAARDARRYLADHRDGFAREEAKDVVLPPGGSRQSTVESRESGSGKEKSSGR